MDELQKTDGKKEKLQTRHYRLERLIKWKHANEVNEMLLTGSKTPREIAYWCAERGFEISHPKLYEYKKLLQESVARSITVERLLGIGVEKSKKNSQPLLHALGIGNVKSVVKNEVELLDALIHMGMNTVTADPTIKVETALRAIELKNKLTAGKHAGLTNFGLDQLREVEKKKFDAMVNVVMKYVPQERIEELQISIENAERNYYKTSAPELLDEYEKHLEDQALDQLEEEEASLIEVETKF